MRPSPTINTAALQSEIDAYLLTTKRSLVEVINQRLFNVVARAIDLVPPTGPNAIVNQRRKVSRYLGDPIDPNQTKRFKTGKRKGQFGKRIAIKNLLKPGILIFQRRRGKLGLKGLYGAELRVQSARWRAARTGSVGFLKTLFVPIYNQLRPLVRYRPRLETWIQSIKVWPDSAGHGSARPATGTNAFASFQVSANLRSKLKGPNPDAERIVATALQQAIDAETADLQKHLAEKAAARFGQRN